MDDTGKRKNLVLGKGLIGSHLASFLEEKGEGVEVLSRGEGHDLREAELYMEQFERADRVWFLAWDTGVRKYEKSAEFESDVLDSNLQLCRSVFRVLQKTKKPFLFVSSQAAPSSEMIPMGVAKRVGEMWTRLLGGHIARLWNVYGWEPVGEKSHLVPDLVWGALQGKKIELMTDGEETRQFLYVRDSVEAFLHQMENGQKEADVVSGAWVKVREVAEIIGQKLGVDVIPGEAPGKPSVFVPSRFLQNWKPRFTLDEGIEETITEARTWQKTNR